MSQVYAIGSNGSGQLGIGHKEDVSVPKPVIFDIHSPTSITQFQAGGNHSLILSEGTLYSSGDVASGARGITHPSASENAHFLPVYMASQDNANAKPIIAFCAATWESSVFVQNDTEGKGSQVYSFGIGNRGELGQGELLFRTAKPQRIKDFPPPGLEVIDLSASVSHTVAVLNNGQVYGWGNGRKGQLGVPEGIVYTPRKLEGLDFEVVKAVCGREFTYLVGDPKVGRHAVLGSDKWTVKSSAPSAIPGWKEIGAAWGSILVLLQDGKIISWGRNDHGQLAPPPLPLISQIAVGSEHALALTTAGDVLAWGWGEHGNCGPGTENGDVKGKWNVIASSKHLPAENSIYKISAGCATSWIFVSG